jgi:hypothetical protein
LPGEGRIKTFAVNRDGRVLLGAELHDGDSAAILRRPLESAIGSLYKADRDRVPGDPELAGLPSG